MNVLGQGLLASVGTVSSPAAQLEIGALMVLLMLIPEPVQEGPRSTEELNPIHQAASCLRHTTVFSDNNESAFPADAWH